MFDTYLPKKFCREFVEAKGNSLQLAMIMATVLGLKPAMDDWVEAKRYPKYKQACKKYGLIVEPDAVFEIVNNKDIPAMSVGRENLTTTKARGRIYLKDKTKGEVHVFLSRTRQNLLKALEHGWYPLIIKNRVIDRPLIDAFKFGYFLGYPDCCIRFFQKYNSWYRYNYMYEIFKNTGKNMPDYLCNSFNKEVTYSYIYHMPCSFACAATIEWATAIRSAILKQEPLFARLIDKKIKRPYLIFFERKSYAFDGVIKNNSLFYKKLYFTGSDPDYEVYGKDLIKGDCLFVEGREVVILRCGKLVSRIKPQNSSFAKDRPFLISF